MQGIIWLASYLKSGNTWLRVFLTNLLGSGERPVWINELDAIPLAARRDLFEGAVGIESSDLTWVEIERLRPEVYEYLAARANETLFFKIHDANTYTADGQPLVSSKATKGAIYIVRNPLDVAVSLARHFGCDFDTAIDYMADEGFASIRRTDRLSLQLRQRLLSWSSHVRSWIDAPGVRVNVTRYEDMIEAPLETFTRVVHFIGWPHDECRIREAIGHSDFQELQRQERAQGFRERPYSAGSFFREGRYGVWRDNLTEKQAARILSSHAEVMARFGYITEAGEIVY